MNGPVLIMAGGTGGHVFPALAVARVLRARGHDVVWLGTRRRIEARLVPAEGIPIEWIDVEGLRGRGLAGWLAAPVKLLRAVSQALAVLRRVRPAPRVPAAWLPG
jgi:UDP-N-acetylglucosamine--N-acetylmuramyl-(pentapeptide) pyrophosphoryl-undecaprenol N-acetylglucosamine transferase